MNRTRITAALLIACAAVPAASAGAQLIGLGVGTMVPQGDLKKGAKTGLAAIAGIEVGGRLALRGEALWVNSDLKGAIIKDGNGIPVPDNANVTGNVKLIGALASLVVHLGVGPIQPYILGGAGYYSRSGAQDPGDATQAFAHASLNDSKVGVHFGAGLKIKVSIISAFAEARYHTVKFDDVKTNFIPVVVGLRLF